MLILFIILAFCLPPIGIPLLLIYFFVHKKGRLGNKANGIELFLSKEDGVSQWFFLLSTFFLSATLVALNRDFGGHISYQTVTLLVTIMGIVIAYLFRSVLPLIFSLLGFASWWGYQAFSWTQDLGIKPYAIVAGLIFIALIYYLMGHLHSMKAKHKRFSIVYLVFGIIAITGYLFILSSKPGLDMLSYLHTGNLIFSSWQIAVSLVLFLLADIGLTVYLVVKKYLFPAEAGAVIMLLLLFATSIFLPEQVVFSGSLHKEFTSTGMMWAIIFNVGLFLELLGLIFSGYVRREEWLINLGVFFLFLLIIVKYFDWFFSFLDKSLFFIGAGLLLFGIGWFMEKGRRQMISKIKTEL